MPPHHIMFDVSCVRPDRRRQILDLLAIDLQERLTNNRARIETDPLYRAECAVLEQQLSALSANAKVHQ